MFVLSARSRTRLDTEKNERKQRATSSGSIANSARIRSYIYYLRDTYGPRHTGNKNTTTTNPGIKRNSPGSAGIYLENIQLTCVLKLLYFLSAVCWIQGDKTPYPPWSSSYNGKTRKCGIFNDNNNRNTSTRVRGTREVRDGRSCARTSGWGGNNWADST